MQAFTTMQSFFKELTLLTTNMVWFSKDGGIFDLVRVDVTHFKNTVNLGYIKLRYNEYSALTNTFYGPILQFYYINQPGYNKPLL